MTELEEKWDTRKVFNVIFDWNDNGIMSATIIQIGGKNVIMNSINNADEASELLKKLTLKNYK